MALEQAAAHRALEALMASKSEAEWAKQMKGEPVSFNWPRTTRMDFARLKR